MAVKIERGGWVLIFLVGVALVGYSLNRYGVVDFSKWTGSGKSTSGSGATLDATKPLVLPASSTTRDAEVKVRVNVWVGCVGGLVANGGLDTQPDSIYGKKGLKVSFKIIDDWTEGSSALATDNVDVMLTTADVYAKDYAQFKEKGFGSHAFLMVDWSRGADGVIGKQGINSIEDLSGKKVAFAPYTPSHFLLWNGLKTSGLGTEQRNEIFNQAVHTKDGIERAYNLIGTVKDFNIPSDLAKTMLGGVKLADYADNRSFMGSAGSNADYNNILGMAQDMYRELRIIKHTFNPEKSLQRAQRRSRRNTGRFTSTPTLRA